MNTAKTGDTKPFLWTLRPFLTPSTDLWKLGLSVFVGGCCTTPLLLSPLNKIS